LIINPILNLIIFIAVCFSGRNKWLGKSGFSLNNSVAKAFDDLFFYPLAEANGNE
jgi:hypothetical protein